MAYGRFAPQEQMFHFHNILKNLTFQRRPKALVWSKGITQILGHVALTSVSQDQTVSRPTTTT